MDLPAIFRRAPQLCLIDELAHTNAPGVEHAKRYQDIEDVLDAGIDVYSTVNIQHLETLNDRVSRADGRPRSRDLPRQRARLGRRGRAAGPDPGGAHPAPARRQDLPRERIATALDSFFKIENLSALRELALREVAEGVESKRLVTPVEMLGTREEQLFGDPPAPVAERILVLVRPDDRCNRLVRRAWRSAQRLAASSTCSTLHHPESRRAASNANASRHCDASPRSWERPSSSRKAKISPRSPRVLRANAARPMCSWDGRGRVVHSIGYASRRRSV